MSTTTLQLYWDLASIDPAVRQNASQALIRLLADFQKDHEAMLDDDDTSDPADTEEELDVLCATDVAYAIRRLLRGLPSSRQGARQGFSLALTELLSVISVVKVKLILDLLFKYTERTSSMPGEEFRDMLFGRLFGLMSIITAGMLTHPSTTYDDVERILDSLKDICQAKSYLIEVSYHVVIQMLAAIKDAEYKDTAVAKIMELFLDEVETVDQLSLALAFQKHLPNVDLSNSFSNWKSSSILATANLPHLATILKETSEEEQENQIEWKPQLHSVWDQLLEIYLGQPAAAAAEANGHAEREESTRPKKKQRLSKKGDSKASSHDDKASFEAFWSATVDGSLFDNNANRGRKYWGFLLVQKVLPRLSAEQVPLIFTENFMRAFINNLSSDVRYLNKSAKYTANVIQKVANENKQVSFALVTQLLGKHGHQHFDRVTKTKTVENLLTTMDAEGIRSYLEYLARVFVQHEETDKVDAARSWVLRQMTLLVKNTRVPKEEGWLGDVVRFLMLNAFFDVKKDVTRGSFFESYRKPTPALSENIRDECKKLFQTVLVALSNMPSLAKLKDQQGEGAVLKTRKFHGVRNDGELWVSYVLQTYQKLAADKHLAIHDALSAESKALFKKAGTLVEQLRKKDTTPESLERGFEILFVHMMLHLLINEDEAQSLLEELFDCHSKIFAKKPKAGKKKSKAAEDDAEPEPIDVLVDILVSFLTNPSPVLKDLAEKVFEIFSHKITKQTLQNLLDILASTDKKHGSEDLFGGNATDDEDEMDSDVEEIEVDSDVDMDEDDEDDNAPVDEELRQKLEETMRSQGVLAGSDDEDEVLGDDAMAGFDEKLAEVFKQKELEKKEKKDLQLSITQFKINVMDLVIIFVRKNPSSPMVLDLIVPLINIIRATPAKSVTGQFVQKIVAFLKNRLPKMHEYPEEHDGHIVDIYQAVYDFAAASSNSEMIDMCVQLSLYLRKCVLGASDAEITDSMPAKMREEIEKLDAITIAALGDYMTKKNTRYRKDMFDLVLQRSPLSSWPLLEALIDYINPAACINLFKHTQATQWITVVVKLTVVKKSQAYNDKFLSLAPKMATHVHAVLEASKDSGSKNRLSYEHMRSFVRFVSTLVRLHKKLVNNDVKKLQKVWKPEWISSITTVDTYNKPGLQTSCKQLVALLEKQ